MDFFPNSPMEKLFAFRENHFETCLYLGGIGIESYKRYQELAAEASVDNPLARYLPSFSLSLFDELGSHGIIEYSMKKELLASE
jgi:hypothetical protein